MFRLSAASSWSSKLGFRVGPLRVEMLNMKFPIGPTIPREFALRVGEARGRDPHPQPPRLMAGAAETLSALAYFVFCFAAFWAISRSVAPFAFGLLVDPPRNSSVRHLRGARRRSSERHLHGNARKHSIHPRRRGELQVYRDDVDVLNVFFRSHANSVHLIDGRFRADVANSHLESPRQG